MSAKLGVVLLGMGLFASVASAAERVPLDAPVTLTGPELYYLDHWDVSPPLGEMPVIPPSLEERRREINPQNVLTQPLEPPPAGWVDPLEQASRAGAPQTRVSVITGLNFDGVGKGLGTYSPSVAPPDTNGAVGASQYVQWVNLHFAVFSKTNGALQYGPAAGNTLWQGFGGACQSYNRGDPIVAYDKAAQRWVMTQFAFGSTTGGPWYQCIAVSTTNSATGTWRRFAYSFPAFNDYPKLGVWPDGYYITFNMFYGLSGARTCVVDRNKMITASATPGPIQCFQLSSSYTSLLPGDLDGATPPPAGSPNFQLNFGSNSLRLWKFKVNWSTPSSTTLTGPTSIAVAAFSKACGGGTCIPQAGTTQKLDSLADRLMHRLAYRKFATYESLVVNHSVATSTAASGVRWYEIRNPNGTPVVYQQGTFSPDATSRWMGSVAMDRIGDIAVGYSASSGSINPGVRYTGRRCSAALGTLQAESTLIGGTGSQTGLSRWGDYSAMTIDPVDDCTFWYTTEYLKTSGSFNWSTRIGSFKFAACSTTGSALTASISRSGNTLTCNVSGGVTPYTYSWYVIYSGCSPCLAAARRQAASGGKAGEAELEAPCPPFTGGEGAQADIPCPEEGPFTGSPPNQWTVGGDELVVRCNVKDSICQEVNVSIIP